MTRWGRLLVVVVVVVLGLLTAPPASATVSVSRAEMDGTRLRLEGTAGAGREITVEGTAMGRSDASGAFRIERDPFTPPADCIVDVHDGVGTPTPARLSGCTATSTPPPTSEPAPADTVAPTAPTNLTAALSGTTATLSWTASSDAVGVTAYRVTRNGVLRGTVSGTNFSDTGLTAGSSYTYTVAAVDAAGNVSAPSNSASVAVPAASGDEGLYFITPAAMPDARVGEAYLGYIVCSDPAGPSTFKFKLVSGRVPDGTRFLGNTLDNRPEARVSGTPTQSGTFSFTVRVQDNTGATASRTFTIRVLAGS